MHIYQTQKTVRTYGLKALLAALLCSTGVTAQADQVSAPETFVPVYIEAINSKSTRAIKNIIHSKSIACLTGKNESLLTQYIEGKFKRNVPLQYKVTAVTKIEPDAPLVAESFFGDMFTYPVRPSHRLQIDYDIAPNHGVSLMPEIALEGKVWKEVLACPKAGTAAWLQAQREQKKIKEAEQAKAVDNLVLSLDKPYVETLIGMGKNGQWIEAVHKIQQDKAVDLTTAHMIMKRLLPSDAVGR